MICFVVLVYAKLEGFWKRLVLLSCRYYHWNFEEVKT